MNIELHCQTYGEGHPVIILHGLFGSLENWTPFGRKLAAEFKVFLVDQRNHGASPHIDEMDYRLMAEDVSGFMQSQGLVEAFVLGHSMGGKTAMQLALLHPQKVRKLIVADIAPRSYAPRHEKTLEGMLSLDLSWFQTRHQMEAALAPAVPDLATRRFLLKNVERKADGGFQWRMGLEEIQRNHSHLRAAVTGETRFQKPALFIRGEHSDYLLEADVDGIRHLFPEAQLRTIARAGHLPHTENPQETLRAVVEFLREPA